MSTRCNPCPPCESPMPETCEPLQTTTQAIRLVVEDSNGCKRTIASAPAGSLLYQDPSGLLYWRTGSDLQPITLDIADAPSVLSGVLGVTPDGRLYKKGASAAKYLCTNDDGEIEFRDFPEITADMLADSLDLRSKTSVALPGESIYGRSPHFPLADADQFLVYDSVTKTLKKVSTLNLASQFRVTGTILQVKKAELNQKTTCNAGIPFDETIPQSNEGNEVLTRTITPISSDSLIRISVSIGQYSGFDGRATAAIFRDNLVDAIGCMSQYHQSYHDKCMSFVAYDEPATTEEVTYKLRFGSTAPVYLLGAYNAPGSSPYLDPYFGGRAKVIMTVEEIAS